MPNKRATNKACVAWWMDKRLKKQMERAARLSGKNVSQFLTDVLSQHVAITPTPSPSPKTKSSAHAKESKTKA
jgi:hypothetical protein